VSHFPQTFPDVSTVASPAVLVYPERIQKNIELMVKIAGDPARLRPHIKTHKLVEVTRMQMQAGIRKFKCATLAEAEMLAKEKVADILLAIQPIGPDILRYVQLAKQFPESQFSVVVDNAGIIHQLNTACKNEGIRMGAFLDLNVGMDRTGIEPGMEAFARYKILHEMEHLDILGLHVYDGHIQDQDLRVRTERVNDAFALAEDFMRQLETMGFAPPVIIAGGSPSFPIHAKRKGVELSPGTTLLWDWNSSSDLPDMEFFNAAFLLTRVVSKPKKGLVCFDLGHKGVAAEMPQPRVRINKLEDAEFVMQSEEHLVAETERSDDVQVGDAFLAIPKHICPTMALYDHVNVVESDLVTGQWKNAARHRL
jgi:D-serine deaminase-like pyridoxal phosphate-dependent protein